MPVPTFLSTIVLPRRRWLLAALGSAALAACGGGEAPDAPTDDDAARRTALDDAARQAVAQGLVGATMAEVLADTVRCAFAGRRTVGAGAAPIAPDDLFAIGSNTKAMSCATISSLVDQGVIALTTTVAQALPTLAATMHPTYAGVTLEQLLAHRGALPAFDGSGDDVARFVAALQAEPGPLPADLAGRRRYAAAWLVGQAPPAGLVPGRDFRYSNAGYALAAAMVEARTGRLFEDLFEQHLLRPLGLQGRWREASEVLLPQPLGHEGPRGSVSVYRPDAETLALESWLRVLAPAGGWACSAAHYARWLQWHLRSRSGQDTPLPATYRQRLPLTDGQYAMGWLAVNVNGRPMWLHTGHTPGFMAEAVVDTAGRQALFGLTNTAFMADDGSSWVLQTLDRLLGSLLR